MDADLEFLQGSWNIAQMEMDGQAMPGNMLAGSRIVVKGNRFTTSGMGADYKGTLVLDPSAKPRRLDMKFESGPEKGNTNLGIYKLGKEGWTLCLATRGATRPRSFATKPGTGIALETLTRTKQEAKSKAKAARKATPPPRAATSPATEFEGEWDMVSGVMNGIAMDKSLVKWVKRVTTGNQTKVIAGPQTMLHVEFTHNPKKKTIDYVNLAGAQKGKEQAGIYDIQDGVLRVCVAAPGDARPADFQSKAGDGRTFTVWTRA